MPRSLRTWGPRRNRHDGVGERAARETGRVVRSIFAGETSRRRFLASLSLSLPGPGPPPPEIPLVNRSR